MNRYVIGSDVGGSHISSAVVDTSTGCLCSSVITTTVDSRGCAGDIIDAWQWNLQTARDGFDGQVSVAGMAFPGPFDYRHGVSLIEGVAKYESIFGLDVTATLRSRLSSIGIKEFRYVNDAAAFALGECLGGSARGESRVVALTLGTGTGSGFVADGLIVENGDEVPANGWIYNLPVGDDIADNVFSTRGLVNAYCKLAGVTVNGAKDIADRCDTDAVARKVFEDYGTGLGHFVRPLLQRFDSRMLVLGGNIARAYHLFGPMLEAALGTDIDVRLTALHDNAALVGAASLFKR